MHVAVTVAGAEMHSPLQTSVCEQKEPLGQWEPLTTQVIEGSEGLVYGGTVVPMHSMQILESAITSQDNGYSNWNRG